MEEKFSADSAKKHHTQSKLFTLSSKRKAFYEDLVERFLLGLADQQLLTGLVMLIVGYLKWDITEYQFEIVCDLVWISSTTHFCAMDLLSDYFRRYKGARSWRIVIMILEYLGLTISLVFTFTDHWGSRPAYPARCLFSKTPGHITKTWNIVGLTLNIVVTTWGYIFTIADFFEPSDRMKRFWKQCNAVIIHILRIEEDLRKKPHARKRKVRARLYEAVRSPKTQVAVTLSANMIWFALGIFYLVTDFRDGLPLIEPSLYWQVYAWGFGQLVPPMLITIPLLTVIEIYYGEISSPFLFPPSSAKTRLLYLLYSITACLNVRGKEKLASAPFLLETNTQAHEKEELPSPETRRKEKEKKKRVEREEAAAAADSDLHPLPGISRPPSPLPLPATDPQGSSSSRSSTPPVNLALPPAAPAAGLDGTAPREPNDRDERQQQQLQPHLEPPPPPPTAARRTIRAASPLREEEEEAAASSMSISVPPASPALRPHTPRTSQGLLKRATTGSLASESEWDRR